MLLLVRHKAHNTVDENVFRLCGVQTLSTLVEMRGVEPLSESTLTGLSPGADGYCGSLSPCSPSGWQAVTPSGQVRVIMRGRGNSYPPHGRHINDAFPGLWPLRFRWLL